MRVLLVLLLLFVFSPFNTYAANVGDAAPDFSATALDGKKISYSADLKGKKPVYLIFWATWCPVCKKELPQVKELHKRLGDRIEFIGINVGINEMEEDVKGYIKKNGLDFKMVFDKDTKISRSFGVMGTPTQLIIDRSGTAQYRGSDIPEDLEGHMKELMK